MSHPQLPVEHYHESSQCWHHGDIGETLCILVHSQDPCNAIDEPAQEWYGKKRENKTGMKDGGTVIITRNTSYRRSMYVAWGINNLLFFHPFIIIALHASHIEFEKFFLNLDPECIVISTNTLFKIVRPWESCFRVNRSSTISYSKLNGLDLEPYQIRSSGTSINNFFLLSFDSAAMSINVPHPDFWNSRRQLYPLFNTFIVDNIFSRSRMDHQHSQTEGNYDD